MASYKVLLIDDDEDVLLLLSHNFIKNGHIVKTARNGFDGIEQFNLFQPDVIIVDLIMPEMDGIEFTQLIRAKSNASKQTAILVFSGRSEDYSQIAALDAGADDYVVKPIRFKILESKVTAILNRYKKTNVLNDVDLKPNVHQDLIQFSENNQVIISGQILNLANKEFQLLQLLCSNPKKIFSREEIYRYLWKKSENSTLRTIDVHIRKLRDKTQLDCIKTMKGVGYKIEL